MSYDRFHIPLTTLVTATDITKQHSFTATVTFQTLSQQINMFEKRQVSMTLSCVSAAVLALYCSCQLVLGR